MQSWVVNKSGKGFAGRRETVGELVGDKHSLRPSTPPRSVRFRYLPCIQTFVRLKAQNLLRIHHDQHGVISILTVFAILMLVILLGYVINVGRQVDSKIRMQNAADGAAYTGGLMLARAMNSLTFTNHLLCDVMALTAFMREARDLNSQQYVPRILDAWYKAGDMLSRAPLPKFRDLGRAIMAKVPLEQRLVDTYCTWANAASVPILPMLEEILAQEMIPQYQRAVVTVFPEIAQQAAMECARLNSSTSRREAVMLGVLWRTSITPVGGPDEGTNPTLPVVDPLTETEFLGRARSERHRYAHHYLREWNRESLRFFDHEAKMCQFASLWRSFTCGYLEKILEEEYPYSNLPHLIRPMTAQGSPDPYEPAYEPIFTDYLESVYTFVAVVYRPQIPEFAASVFQNPIDSDSLAYAAVRMFVPRQRLVWWQGPPGRDSGDTHFGGVPGDMIIVPDPSPPSSDAPIPWEVRREPGISEEWSLWNQRWTVQLVPANCVSLSQILQVAPPLLGNTGAPIRVPNLANLGTPELSHISPH